MTDHYDALETRSADQRAADLAAALPRQVARAQEAPAMAALLAGVDPAAITTREALAALPGAEADWSGGDMALPDETLAELRPMPPETPAHAARRKAAEARLFL